MPALREGLEGEAEPERLSESQTAAVARIVGAMDAGRGGPFLLHGATGSGKTEVYLQACAAALERGLGAIVLVPEIALTPQAVGRFRARFGDRIAILHSALTDAERLDERERILAGDARVVIGARSAVFAPVRGLGLLVVDEEHDASYKQDSDPRYDARTVAAKRAALEQRRRGVRNGHAAAGELGAARADRARREALRRAAARPGRRPAARGRLPAVGAAARGARPGRRRRRQGDPAPQPPRDRARRSTAAPAG